MTPKTNANATAPVAVESIGEETIHHYLPEQIYVDQSANGRFGNYSPAEIKAFAATIARAGQLQPVTVVPFVPPTENPDGTPLTEEQQDELAAKSVRLVFGYRRYLAIRYLNETSGAAPVPVRCQVVDWDEAQILDNNARENAHRKNLTPMDRAKLIGMLMEDGRKMGEIAETLGMKPAMVSQYKALLSLVPDAQQMCHDGRLTVRDAYNISSLDAEAQQRIVTKRLAELEREAEEAAADKKGDAKKGKAVKGKGKGKKSKSSKAVKEEVSHAPKSARELREFFANLSTTPEASDGDNPPKLNKAEEAKAVLEAKVRSIAAATLKLMESADSKANDRKYVAKLLEIISS